MKALLIVVLVLALAAIAALAVYRSTRPYAVLFTELSSEDMTSVLSYLNTNNVKDYKIENNNTILVREDQEASLKAAILMQGYPTSGYAYDTYLNNVGTLSSESDRQVLRIYDLQERLGKVIRNFAGVSEAEVFITEGEDNRYILSSSDKVPASASVVVTMKNGQTLSDDAAVAIRRLVTNAVSGLNVENVEISDKSGNSYTSGDAGSSSSSAKLRLDLENQINESVYKKVRAVLVPLFGADNLSITVNSTVDVSVVYTDATIYEEPAWAANGQTNGQGIIGSRVWGNSIVRDGDGEAGGVAGTSTNADLNEYVVNESDLDGSEREIATSGEIQYDVTQRRQQTQSMGGTVTDLTVAVVINSTAVEVPNLDAITDLVATAAAISPQQQGEKITILAYPFYETEEAPSQPGITEVTGLPAWVLYAAIAGAALFIILLVLVIFLTRAKKKKKKQQEEERAAMEALQAEQLAAEQLEGEDGLLGRPEMGPTQLAGADGSYMMSSGAAEAITGETGELVAGEAGADIMDINTEKSMQLRKSVRQFAEENPAIAAQMLKNWLRGGEENA